MLLLGAAGCERPATPHAEVPAATPARTDGVSIHGHRGARGLAPESTLPAFEVALDLEVDVLELDLQLTRDGKLAIWHNSSIGAESCRVAGAPVLDVEAYRATDFTVAAERPLDAPVVDPETLEPLHPALAIPNQRADQLRKLKCDRNPDTEKFPDQKRTDGGDYGVIDLDELFDFVKRYAEDPAKTLAQRANAKTVGFNIETKRDTMYPTYIADRFDGENPGLFERTLHETLERHNVSNRTIVQSFDHRSLWAMKKINETVRLAALDRKGAPNFDALAKAGADVWSPKYKFVTSESVASAHRAGLQVIPYTVNTVADARALIAVGVDGLITDRPDLVHGGLSASK